MRPFLAVALALMTWLEPRAARSVAAQAVEARPVVAQTVVAQGVVAQTVVAQTVDPQLLGPKVGERVPDFSLPDQRGVTRSLKSTFGPNGGILVFFRSADW